jgi:hypothetical protein
MHAICPSSFKRFQSNFRNSLACLDWGTIKFHKRSLSGQLSQARKSGIPVSWKVFEIENRMMGIINGLAVHTSSEPGTRKINCMN